MLKMTKNGNIEEYSQYLGSISNEINKTDVCYGKQALILFYLYKYKVYSDQDDYEYYNALIEECVNDLAEGNDIIGIIEFLYIHLLYKEDFEIEYDLSEVIGQFEALAFSHLKGCLNKNNLDGYYGAGYPIGYFLLKREEMPEELVDQITSNVRKNVTNLNDGSCYIKLTEGSKNVDLGITHGLSFMIKTYLDFYKLNCLTTDDISLLNKFIKYIKVNYKDFLAGEKAYNIAYGSVGLLYTLIYYNSFFGDKELDAIIAEIFKILSENREAIYTDNNNSLLYGNTGIVLFYNMIQTNMNIDVKDDQKFWNNKILNIMDSDSGGYSLAEGKIGHYLAYMGQILEDYSFMNLFFINKI